MLAINATPMATVHVGIAQNAPPSPTLTNPDSVLPYSGTLSSSSPLASSPLLRQHEPSLSASYSSGPSRSSSRQYQDPQTEVGVATAIKMPIRIKPSPPTTLPQMRYSYAHGGTLSDIGEEEMTPKSRTSRRSLSPPHGDSESPTPQPRWSTYKHRLSDQSSSGGSEVGDWENFDTSRMMTGRLAADVAREDEEEDAPDSKRNSVITLSNEDRDEMTVLNAKAERILANARKRLTHMEDNLTKARHSVYMGDRVLANMRSSPNMSELHQRAGGLYRSISLASRKSKQLCPVVKATPQIHTRGLSDTTAGNGLKRLSMVPQTRSSSAQEYDRRMDSPQHTPQSRFSPSLKYNVYHSPASSRSVNSPMHTLEEEAESPSTVNTSPESGLPRGLGINTLANDTKENVSVLPASSSPSGLFRSASAASATSIRDQMTHLRSKMSDLQIKTKADRETRQNSNSRNTPSPFTNASNPEHWYTSAPEYKEGGSPYSANAGVGWSPVHEQKPSIDAHLTPVTPQAVKFLGAEPPTTGESARFDIRTDVNTPSLHKRVIDRPPGDADAADSIIQESLYEDAAQDFDDDEYHVAASEEEQIYLNEMLEESLQDIEPDVPSIPAHLLPADGEAERHEDRLDAFDYENMFLHSAMGNFASRSRSGSEGSDTSSVATKRGVLTTPSTNYSDGDGSDGQDEEEDETVLDPRASEHSRTTPVQQFVDEDAVSTPKGLDPPMKPWLKHSQRSQSMDSVSTVATFATATEGGQDEEEEEAPNEILTWGHGTAFPRPPLTSPKRDVVRAWPTPSVSCRLPQQRGVISPVKSPGGSTSYQPQINLTPGNVLKNGMPTPTHSPMATAASATEQQDAQMPTSQPDHPANTEILMESLIKLADPDFKVQDPDTFADVDKDLVLSLLRAVGGVCNGVLKAEQKRETRDVKVLRRRLDLARRVLQGESSEE